MKKLVSLTLWIISIYIAIVLFLSLALTQNSFYSFLAKTYTETNPSFELVQVNWHPSNPSVVLKDLKLESKEQNISLDQASVEFSLVNLIKGNFISRLLISELTINTQNNKNQSIDIPGLFNFLKDINELSIKDLKINSYSGAKNISADLNSFLRNGGLNLNLIVNDGKGAALEIGVFPNSESNRAIFNGYINANGFSIDKNLLSTICKICNSNAELRTSATFSFINNKPLSIQGNLDLTLDKDILGFNSLSSSFKLKDSNQVSIQISSFLGKGSRLKVPDLFLYLSPEEEKILIPEINLSQDKLFKHILANLFNNLSIDLTGKLRNSIIEFRENRETFSTSLIDLGIGSNAFSLDGLAGRLILNEERGTFIIHSPSMNISSDVYLDRELNFNDFKSILNFNLSAEDLEILPSEFSVLLENRKLEGLVSLPPIPSSGRGNLNLRVRSDLIDDRLALTLFPNTPYLSTTKSAVENLINCGSFEDVSLILRVPVDGIYKNNSGSFGMEALGKNVCLEFNGHQIKKVNSRFQLNNFELIGKFTDADLYKSSVAVDYRIYKNISGSMLDIKGESDGPFISLINLFRGKNFSEENIQGTHKTKFEYITPLKKDIKILDKDSSLEVRSKIDKASLSRDDMGLSLSNIFSSFNYDSASGFSEGFISLKLNSIPVVLELDPNLSGKDYTIFSFNNALPFTNFLPKHLKNRITGSSLSSLELGVPSLLKGRIVKDTFVRFSSEMIGTEINLPAPLYKDINQKIDLKLEFFPSFNSEYSRLKFRYGDLFRGKLNLRDKGVEGFVIAGKKKQSISIERERLSLIGNISKLDLSLLSLFDTSGESQKLTIDIKQLKVDEILFANFVFPETFLSSQTSDNYLELEIKNKNLSGKVFFPRLENLEPLIDLETVNLNFSGTSNSSFLDIYNNLNQAVRFRTKSLILNSVDYGNWSFNLKPSKSSLMLDDIEGSYGKWGLTHNQKGISRLLINKKALGWSSNLESKIFSGSPEKGFLQFGIQPNFEMDTIFAEANLSWSSLPWNFQYDNFNGDIYLEIEGLLIKNQKDLQRQNNILRLINIFNITDSFEKVTNLDFRKLYKSGFSADSVKGSLNISPNLISLESPLIFRSGSSEFKWQGKINRNQDGDLGNLNLEVVMTLPLREYLPAYAFLLGGPVTAGVVYIAGKAFEKNLDQLSSGSWSIKGTLDDPKTNFNGWFEGTRD